MQRLSYPTVTVLSNKITTESAVWSDVLLQLQKKETFDEAQISH